MQTAIDEGKLKQFFKEALMEILKENQNIFHDIVTEAMHDIVMEAMEDIALSRAIQEGEGSGATSKKEVFDMLEGRA